MLWEGVYTKQNKALGSARKLEKVFFPITDLTGSLYPATAKMGPFPFRHTPGAYPQNWKRDKSVAGKGMVVRVRVSKCESGVL